MNSKAFEERYARTGPSWQIAPDVAFLPLPIVNVYMVGAPETGPWVLIDAGLPGTAGKILDAAAERFGPDARPEAIIMTHGHFDHVGALRTLAERWNVPVYAHPLELPYLTGRSNYPPADPTVGGGAMARLSFLYPHGPIDLGGRVLPLPEDGSVPGMPGWRWLHTPGHSPGHVSLFRDSDRTLIVGDAFVTTKQESAIAALTKPQEMHGPPMHFTPDWRASHDSVTTLAALRPAVAATGHGIPMWGDQLQVELEKLARDFDRVAVPERGRYVPEPAVMNTHGVVSLPPPTSNPLPVALGIAAAVLTIGIVAVIRRRRNGGAG